MYHKLKIRCQLQLLICNISGMTQYKYNNHNFLNSYNLDTMKYKVLDYRNVGMFE